MSSSPASGPAASRTTRPRRTTHANTIKEVPYKPERKKRVGADDVTSLRSKRPKSVANGEEEEDEPVVVVVAAAEATADGRRETRRRKSRATSHNHNHNNHQQQQHPEKLLPILQKRKSSSTYSKLTTAATNNSNNNHSSNRVDGGLILSRTQHYTIKQLPGLPDTLRKDRDSANYRAFYQALSQHTHKVIVTTARNVQIWDYNTTVTSPVPYTLSLPDPLKLTDRPPLAASVVLNGSASASSNNDTGLVVVSPASGKIFYWPESEAANTISLYQRNATYEQGQVSLMSAEIVEKLIRVEHGGFILVLSSGRLFYLSLQDRNSKASVSAYELQNDAQVGFFGRISATLSGGWRNSVVGVKTRAKTNRFETIALTQEGALKVWDVQYQGNAVFRYQIDLAPDVRHALKDVDLFPGDDKKAQLTFVDFDFAVGTVKKPSTAVSRQGEDAPLETIILISVTENGSSTYLLAHTTIIGVIITISRFTPIHVYSSSTPILPSVVDLIIPPPSHSAFIVMSNAVITASLLPIYGEDGVDPHVYLQKPTYQDIVYFQYKLNGEIVSAAPEFKDRSGSKSEAANLLLFTKKAGGVRITAEKPPIDVTKQLITPKDKIEQEVFFGKHAQPILDFGQSGSFKFHQKDVEEAALQLSHEILTSNNPNVDDNMDKPEVQIYWRINYLKRLIDFVLAKYSPVSRSTRWRLLWDAEKMEAVRKLWKVYDEWVARKDDDQKILLPLFVKAVGEKERGSASNGDAETTADGDAAVRKWFAHDVPKIGKLINHIEAVMIDEHRLQKGKWELLVQYIAEAQDVIKGMLSTAYDFRRENLSAYRLEEEPFADGILKTVEAYTDLSEPWTATRNICGHLEGYVSATTRLLIDLSEEAGQPGSKIDGKTLVDLRKHQWQLVLITCFVHTERGRWVMSRPDEDDRVAGQKTLTTFEQDLRPDLLLGLADLGRASDGMKIAEKIGDLEGLVNLCLAEIEFLTDPDERLRMEPGEKQATEKKRKEMYERLSGYFDRYGMNFSEKFFTTQVESGRLADLLQLDFGKGKDLNAYLRARPDLGKLTWMNEVLRARDLKRAGETLLKVASEREGNVWAQDQELALAYLATIAAEATSTKQPRKNKQTTSLPKPAATNGDKYTEAEAHSSNTAKEEFIAIKRRRDINALQEKVYAHLRPTFQLGIDKAGAVDSAMEIYGKYAVKDRDANAAILREGIEAIRDKRTMPPELLIDVLTLMDDEKCDDERNSLQGKLFLMALKVLEASGWCEGKQAADSPRGEDYRNLIWKRLFVRDDWVGVHHLKSKREKDVARKLGETSLFRHLYEGGLEKLWNSTPAFTTPEPTTCIDALGTADSLAWRFGGNLELAKPIAKDNGSSHKNVEKDKAGKIIKEEHSGDGGLLIDYVTKCRLGFNWQACVELAAKAVSEFEERNEKGRREAREKVGKEMQAREREAKGGLRGDLPGEYEDGLEEEEGAEGDLLTEDHLREFERDEDVDMEG